MYIAALFILAGEALLFQSMGLVIYILVMFGFFTLVIRFIEEPYLTDKFGDTYEQYRKCVPRWIPCLTPYRKDESESLEPTDEEEGNN